MTFLVQVNGGETHELKNLTTTEYGRAAMVAFGTVEYEKHPDYDVVKIWDDQLIVPDSSGRFYGPYFYAFDGNMWGRPDDDRKW